MIDRRVLFARECFVSLLGWLLIPVTRVSAWEQVSHRRYLRIAFSLQWRLLILQHRSIWNSLIRLSQCMVQLCLTMATDCVILHRRGLSYHITLHGISVQMLLFCDSALFEYALMNWRSVVSNVSRVKFVEWQCNLNRRCDPLVLDELEAVHTGRLIGPSNPFTLHHPLQLILVELISLVEWLTNISEMDSLRDYLVDTRFVLVLHQCCYFKGELYCVPTCQDLSLLICLCLYVHSA